MKKKKSLYYKGRYYRSLFEVAVARQLYDAGMKFSYESKSYKYLDPIPHGYCEECGSREVFVERTYTPDFFLHNGIIIEAKGKLDFKQRKKLKAIKKSNPEIELHILFMRDQPISKGSSTLYTEWAYRNGFEYQVKIVPKRWLIK